MTLSEIKEMGRYNTHMKFNLTVDPEQKAEMWKLGDDYYWVEEGEVITKMQR